MDEVPNNGTTYIVDDTDLGIVYSPGWLRVSTTAEYNDTKTGANAAGMTATFVFNGTGIEVYGSLGSWDVYGVPVSTYEIDGFPDTQSTYTAPLIKPGTFAVRVPFYRSPPLQPAVHTLVITNINGTAPSVYWLDYIIYSPSSGTASTATPASETLVSQTSVTAPASSSSAISTSSLTSISSGSSNTPTSTAAAASTTSHTGAIAGGVVGGVAFLAALVFLPLWFCYRKRHRATPGEVDLFAAWPADRVVQPSMSTSGKLQSTPGTPNAQIHGMSMSSTGFPVASTSSLPESRFASTMQPSQTGVMQGQSSSPVLRLHSDSGIRLPQGKVVDIPPAYTDD